MCRQYFANYAFSEYAYVCVFGGGWLPIPTLRCCRVHTTVICFGCSRSVPCECNRDGAPNSTRTSAVINADLVQSDNEVFERSPIASNIRTERSSDGGATIKTIIVNNTHTSHHQQQPQQQCVKPFSNPVCLCSNHLVYRCRRRRRCSWIQLLCEPSRSHNTISIRKPAGHIAVTPSHPTRRTPHSRTRICASLCASVCVRFFFSGYKDSLIQSSSSIISSSFRRCRRRCPSSVKIKRERVAKVKTSQHSHIRIRPHHGQPPPSPPTHSQNANGRIITSCSGIGANGVCL